jgi:hypothetical protein
METLDGFDAILVVVANVELATTTHSAAARRAACLGFGGATVDRRVSEELLKAVSPLGMEASLAAIEHRHAALSDRRAALTRELEQREYEARRAFEQYDQADPHNRLVAEVLERRWNEKLEAVERVKAELTTEQAAAPPLTTAEKETILALGERFELVWNADSCPMVLKEKITRTLIEEIMVDLDDEGGRELRFVVHWKGGCHTTFTMPKPMSGAVVHKTALEDLDLITRMARRYQDDEIARVLSKLGRRTGKGHRWTASRVAYVRKKYKLPAIDKARASDDVLTPWASHEVLRRQYR